MHGNIKPWFDLARHEDPVEPVPPVVEPVVETVVEPEKPADPVVEPDKGKADDKDAEIAKWRAMARKHEANAKTNSDAAKKLADIEAASLTEAEKLATAKDAAEKRATAAIERAVRAEVKALAADAFADPSDAVDALKAADYVDSDGEIDLDAIKGKLADLLEAKPHWKKAAPAVPVAPGLKPDPGQGARQPVGPTNFKDAPKDEFAKELATYGLTPRS